MPSFDLFRAQVWRHWGECRGLVSALEGVGKHPTILGKQTPVLRVGLFQELRHPVVSDTVGAIDSGSVGAGALSVSNGAAAALNVVVNTFTQRKPAV